MQVYIFLRQTDRIWNKFPQTTMAEADAIIHKRAKTFYNSASLISEPSANCDLGLGS